MIVLKPGREKSLLRYHPWIFSGAIASWPSFENGEVLSVYSEKREFLAKAYFHRDNSLSGRVLTFRDEPVEEVLALRLKEAIRWRQSLFDPEVTNTYRLVNAEGDGLPGLIIDLYDDVAVFQIATTGMERLKSQILSLLLKELPLTGVYEKSISLSRFQEGLSSFEGVLYGSCPQEVLVKENGVLFVVDIQKGQKTGLFLDQRQMRQLVHRLACGKRVLNCFAYTGGFSLFALKGGALSVTSVDSSEPACRSALENTRLNGLDRHIVVCQDAFEYCKREPFPFDFVILDPPAFAKKRQDIQEACRGYKEINRLVLQRLPPSSYLLTSSCSHFVDETLFGQILFQAAQEAGREARICSHHIQAPDHPTSLFHPEGGYLKSLLLFVR